MKTEMTKTKSETQEVRTSDNDNRPPKTFRYPRKRNPNEFRYRCCCGLILTSREQLRSHFETMNDGNGPTYVPIQRML
jgi:hypothetical protein